MADHSPNTCEFSKPHTSDACPETHVDQYSYGEDVHEVRSMRVDHITDPGAVSMGQQTYEWHQSQSSDDSDNSGDSGK